MRNRPFRTALLAFGLVTMAACRVVVEVPPGGIVEQQSSGAICRGDTWCYFDVKDTEFEDTFTAQPYEGYRFAGWKKADRHFCGGRREPCGLSTKGFPGTPLMGFLDSDETFFLIPIFERDPDAGCVAPFDYTYVDEFGCQTHILRTLGEYTLTSYGSGQGTGITQRRYGITRDITFAVERTQANPVDVPVKVRFSVQDLDGGATVCVVELLANQVYRSYVYNNYRMENGEVLRPVRNSNGCTLPYLWGSKKFERLSVSLDYPARNSSVKVRLQAYEPIGAS